MLKTGTKWHTYGTQHTTNKTALHSWKSCRRFSERLLSRGVVVNFDFGERFPRPTSQQRGRLRPCEQRVAVLGVGRGVTSRNFLDVFGAKSHVCGQFGPENKLIEGQPNEYDMICWNAFSVSVPPMANDIFRSAVQALKYLPEQRSRTTTHLLALHVLR